MRLVFSFLAHQTRTALAHLRAQTPTPQTPLSATAMASAPPAAAAAAPNGQSRQQESTGSVKHDREPGAGDSDQTGKKPKHNSNNNGKRGRGGRGGARGGGRGDRRGGGGGDSRDAWRRDYWSTDKLRRGGRDRNAERAEAGGAASGDGAAARPFAATSNMRIAFSAEEIAAETRRPKRKVAVLLGYAGTGYHGLQINHDDKTIEGDLFAAFVAAGAIAKANADDPKKSSLVRCARTDKGVHAAGNVLSLKMILDGPKAEEAEEADGASSASPPENTLAAAAAATTARINAHLPPQIRVWGIHRTLNSFNCYQACDSRWYEYLLPSYALLPPHPDSFLGREMRASAQNADAQAPPEAQDAPPADDDDDARSLYADMLHRLADVQDFWPTVERDVVQPLLDGLDPDVRRDVRAQLHTMTAADGDGEGKTVGRRGLDALEAGLGEEGTKAVPEAAPAATTTTTEGTEGGDAAAAPPSAHRLAVEQALRDVKTAYVAAKRRYRVTPARLGRLQEALAQYEGTHNFHNYTVQKAFGDASAKRHIKSFVVNPAPIQIRDTEWLSLRVHGQSFMMHQIRKMVAMAVMVARCGTAPARAMPLSYGPRRISIPKAPGFGLLLERPVFDTYNQRAALAPAPAPGTAGADADPKAALDFAPYEAAIRAFKDQEIYARIWDVEESQNVFHAFFHQLDHFRTSYYLWAIPGGYDAAFERFGGRGSGGSGGSGQREPAPLPGQMHDVDSDDDGANANEHEG